MTSKEFTKAFPSLRSAPEILLRDLLAMSARTAIPAGTRLYNEEDACSAIAFILAGEVRVYKIGESGREITLYEIGPGETCILNASCILAGQSYPANATTVEDSDLLMVPAAGFRKFVSENEQMRDFVFRLLSRRLAGVMELVEEVAFGRMSERLMDYLVERSSDGRLEATHQRIANDLGTSREVVSRLLKDLEREGKVRIARSEITLLQGQNDITR